MISNEIISSNKLHISPLRLLHLMHFDKKFVLVAAEIFDSYSGAENLFIVITKNVEGAARFFHGRKNILVVSTSYIYSAKLENDLKQSDCLVIHYLDGIKAKAILRAPKELPIVWSAWGADYFELITKNGEELLGEQTKQLSRHLNKITKINKHKLIRNMLHIARCIRHRIVWGPRIKKTIGRINFFSCPFINDYGKLTDQLGINFRPIYSQLFYGSVDRTYAPGSKNVYGEDILVGNSAYDTNNHLEAFELLSQINLGHRRIITPLSYGDSDYRDAIIIRGRALFGDRFFPVIEFMPLEKYNTLIACCSIVVMAHKRQQGGGNALTLLYKGAKVFLDEASAVYTYLKENGAYVYSLQYLKEMGRLAFEPLSDEQKKNNREVLERYSGTATVSTGTRRFAEMVRIFIKERQ